MRSDNRKAEITGLNRFSKVGLRLDNRKSFEDWITEVLLCFFLIKENSYLIELYWKSFNSMSI